MKTTIEAIQEIKKKLNEDYKISHRTYKDISEALKNLANNQYEY